MAKKVKWATRHTAKAPEHLRLPNEYEGSNTVTRRKRQKLSNSQSWAVDSEKRQANGHSASRGAKLVTDSTVARTEVRWVQVNPGDGECHGCVNDAGHPTITGSRHDLKPRTTPPTPTVMFPRHARPNRRCYHWETKVTPRTWCGECQKANGEHTKTCSVRPKG
jgi:hypothetical protein